MKKACLLISMLVIAWLPAPGRPPPAAAVTGRVTDASNGAPVAGAHVFLAYTQRGSVTDAGGRYTIDGVAEGSYTLVVSMLGYETVRRPLDVPAEAGVEDVDVELHPVAYELEGIEVTARSNRRWQRRFRRFRRLLLGESDHAAACTILNPLVVEFRGATSNRLQAIATAPLIIENRALGYRITFVLREFVYDAQSGILRYQGEPFFEPLEPAGPEERDTWERHREDAYRGSLAHLLSSIIDDRTFEESFLLYDTRSENPLRGKNMVEPGPLPSQFELTYLGRMRVVYRRIIRRGGRRLFGTRTVEEVSDLLVNASRGLIQRDGYYRPPDLFTVFGAMSERRLADALPREYGLKERDE